MSAARDSTRPVTPTGRARITSSPRRARSSRPPRLASNRHFEYVLALLFTGDGKEVVLVRKTRPAWQAGRVNALGGKLHDGETLLEGARREVREEAGVDVEEWEEFLVWEDPQYRLRAVRAFSDAARLARTAEDQEVFLAHVGGLPLNAI